VYGLATNRAKQRPFAASALLVHHIHIPHQTAPATPERALGTRGGKGGPFFAAGGANFAFPVDIFLDPAPCAVHGLATNRAKRRPLAAPARHAIHIHVPRDAAPAAPERALGARGSKGGPFFAAGGAHFADQVDIPLDPAPCAVHALATTRAKRRLPAAPALIVLHIHITRYSAPATPDWLLGASAGEIGLFFAADGALGHVFLVFWFWFWFFFFFSFFLGSTGF
jgi:hypothetical protein